MVLASLANAQLDNNQNGMSDPWERRFNQGSLFDISQTAHQPDADPDGDGFANSMESITGTNPFQGQTAEGVIRATVSQTAAGRQLKWPVVPGKRYTAQHSTTLATGSWKAVGQPMVAAKGQTEGSLAIPPDLLAGKGFFQVAVRDVDTDFDDLTDSEEHLLGTSPLHSYSLHGVGDYWLAKHFTDLGSFDPDAAPHGDGMTYREAYQLNLNPHLLKAVQARTQGSGSGTVLGDEAFINGDFTQPSIGTGVRKEVTNAQWDYWDTTSGWDTNVNGWTAVNGTNIEFQKFNIAEGKPYCELQAHPDAHNGLKQTIKVVPGKTYLFMLDYRARANVTSGVQVFADETELTLSDLADVGGWTPKVATFTKPVSSEDESEAKVEVTFKITPPTGGTAGGTGFVKNVRLVPVDLDIEYASQGGNRELEDSKEDTGDGGYISLKSQTHQGEDITPTTYLIIRPTSGLPSDSKVRLKFNSGGRYKVAKDRLGNDPVVSESTEFPAGQETRLYLVGETKSQSRGGEQITMQISKNGLWDDEDSLKATVVQTQFQIDLRVFIPYNWVNIPLHTSVAGGDTRSYDPSLSGTYRVSQKTILNLYKEWVPDIGNRMIDNGKSAGITYHYSKSDVTNFNSGAKHSEDTAVKPSYVNHGAIPSNSGIADLSGVEVAVLSSLSNDNRVTVEFEGEAAEPILPIAAPINWRFSVGISKANPLNPSFSLEGAHDGFPAYEIYVNCKHQKFPHAEVLTWKPPLSADVWELVGDLDVFVGPVTGSINQ